MLTIEHPHVLDDDVLDDGLLAGILANGAHGLAMRTVAVHGVDVRISQIGLGREAVVANVDPDFLHLHVLDIQGVEEICVLREGSRLGFLKCLLVTETTEAGRGMDSRPCRRDS